MPLFYYTKGGRAIPPQAQGAFAVRGEVNPRRPTIRPHFRPFLDSRQPVRLAAVQRQTIVGLVFDQRGGQQLLRAGRVNDDRAALHSQPLQQVEDRSHFSALVVDLQWSQG